jgi:3-hydroxyacyl-CoA dehydrogenase
MIQGQKLVVVMPAYNAARTLRQTYDEVMAQGIVDLVILVDDASKDETVAMAKVSNSAVNAKELGLMRATDKVVFNSFETLHIAKAEVLALAEGGYRPPMPARRIQVAGDVGIATFKMMLVNMLEGRFISPYDYEIAVRIATVLCGGEVDRGTLVDEEWLLTLERKHFVELAQQEKTQARIAHMLKTGKPLRN